MRKPTSKKPAPRKSRIADLEARLAAAEARIAILEARSIVPLVNPAPAYPWQEPFKITWADGTGRNPNGPFFATGRMQ